MAKMVDIEETTAKVQEVIPEKTVVSKDNYYVIKGLPSGGKFYPQGTEIMGRPLKVLEVKQLSAINEDNADNIINSILRKSVKGLPIDDILIADKLFIMFWLRTNTYRESNYILNYKCGTCKEEVSYEFLLENLGIKNVPDTFSIERLTFKLKGNQDEIKFGFPTIKQERVADEFKNNASYINNIDTDIVGLCVLIKSINGESKSMLEKYNYIISLDPSDYAYLISYINKWSFGIDPIVNATCKNCGGVSLMGVSFQGDFWIPSICID
jgi:hypothetical protein